MGTSGIPPVPSTGGQDDLEKKYKLSQIRAAWAQVVATGIAIAAIIVTIIVAWQGQAAVNHNSQVALQQSEDSQLATAITSLGSGNTAERVAGLLLLARNTASRFPLASKSGEARANVYDDYTTALQIFSGYLSSHGEAFLTGTSAGKASTPFGRGYGVPPTPGLPLDLIYAANQIKFMVGTKLEREVSKVTELNAGRPAIDLAHDELIGQQWRGINFGWLWAFMVRIDLRGANLEQSQWSKRSDLSNSYLQCADLKGAVFRGADLTYADLRGANVNRADFRGAKLKGVRITQVYGIAKWPRWLSITALPVDRWDQGACLQKRKFWDNYPTSVPASASPPSPKPSSSPTPEPSSGKGI
jgi:hypothetical protein